MVVSPVTRVVPLPLPHDVDVLVIHREAVSIAAVGRACTQHTRNALARYIYNLSRYRRLMPVHVCSLYVCLCLLKPTKVNGHDHRVSLLRRGAALSVVIFLVTSQHQYLASI